MLSQSKFAAITISLLLLPSTSASIYNNLNFHSHSTNEYHDLPILKPRTEHLEQHLRKRQENGETQTFLDGYFSSGIASGDPDTSSVVLWTRFAPCDAVNKASSDRFVLDEAKKANTADYPWPTYGPKASNPVNQDLMTCVTYKIWPSSEGDEGEAKAKFGPRAYTSAEIDWTIKFIAPELSEFTSYKYRFYQCNKETKIKSAVGNTKTLPDENNELAKGIKLTMFTCSNMPWGFFNSYSNTVVKKSRQPDYVVFLGDYIYEFQAGTYQHPKVDTMKRKAPISTPLITLRDFRERYAQYRSDKSLQDNHASFPWIAIWDDHELGDNAWNEGMTWWAYSQYTNFKGGRPAFTDVKHNSVRAYFEWMPIRQQKYENNLRIWRQFKMGKLINLMMIDTREYDRDIAGYTGAGPKAKTQSLPGYPEDTNDKAYKAHRMDPDPIDKNGNPTNAEKTRTMMGADQEKWFKETFENSDAKWQVIGNAVIFSPAYLGSDSWHGYPATRTNMMDWIGGQPDKRTIILTGDSHMNWVHDIAHYNVKGYKVKPYNRKTGEGAIAVEFCLTGVSSPPPGTLQQSNWKFHEPSAYNPKGSITTSAANHGLLWSHKWSRGYMEMDITNELVTTRYIGTPCITSENNYERLLAEFQVDHKNPYVKRFPDGSLFADGGKFGAGGLHKDIPGQVVAEEKFAVMDVAAGTKVTILPVQTPDAGNAVASMCNAVKGATDGFSVFTPAPSVPEKPETCPAQAVQAKRTDVDIPAQNDAMPTGIPPLRAYVFEDSLPINEKRAEKEKRKVRARHVASTQMKPKRDL